MRALPLTWGLRVQPGTPQRHFTLFLSEPLEGGQTLDRRLVQAVAAEAGLRGVSWRGEVYPSTAYR